MTTKRDGEIVVLRQKLSNEMLYGDINKDGKVDSEDAQIVLAHAASMLPFDVTDEHISDVGGDGKVTATDALLVLKSVVSLHTITTDQQTRADVDWNASITAADALLILKRVVNLIDCFPAEKYM